MHRRSGVLDRSARDPLWKQLLDDLRARVAGGEFAGAFPGELALSEEYGVSRHTVREAVLRLRAAGMVAAGRGRIPRVVPATELEQPLGALYSIFAAVEAAGLPQVSVVRALDVRADAVVADRLALEGSTPLVYLERVRLAGAEPLAWDRVWLPAGLAAPLLDADFTRTSLYAELSRHCGVRLSSGAERLQAVVPNGAQRRLLGIDDATAAFGIDRIGVADGTPVEWRQTLVRGDRWAMSAQFSGREGYRIDVAGNAGVAARFGTD